MIPRSRPIPPLTLTTGKLVACDPLVLYETVYVGRDAAGRPARFVTDFLLLDAPPQPPPPPPRRRWWRFWR